MAILFVVIAAGLVLAALAVVIVPLTRAVDSNRTDADAGATETRLAVLRHGLGELDADFRSGAINQGEYDEARRELEQQALDADTATRPHAATDRKTGWRAALVFGAALPLAAIILYTLLGQPAALRRPAGPPPMAANGPHGTGADMAAMTRQLAARLEQDNGSLEGWLLLARSYQALGQLQHSVAAYQKAAALGPDNANLLIEYASTLSIAQGRDLSGKPWQLIQHALEVAPDNLNALALAGAAAVQDGRSDDAVRYWSHLKRQLPAGSPDRAKIDGYIARVQANKVPASSDVAIHGTVKLSKALTEEVSAADTLFIYAKAADGPPMPLAIVRSSPGQWPVSFTLDNGSAMMPDLYLSQYPRVNIIARISRTGDAQPRPGDLQGRVDGVALGSSNVQIVIDTHVSG